MSRAVLDDEMKARRYTVLRLMDVMFEHKHDLLPSTAADAQHARARILPIAIGEQFIKSEPWLAGC
jgi:hypothetical protein